MNDQPYLSVVVTARNDDHGGNLLGRMQIFLNAWFQQVKRHHLVSELIVVDWNPPPDRPPLMDALQWPADTGPCQVRFIQVPPAVHRQYRHGASLPLYQMIAKNVAMRRAKGRFILATNIDIIFSDELLRFIAGRHLQPGRMYRMDRHDVMPHVPVDGTIAEQLDYCSTHLIRVCAREGYFELNPDGSRRLAENDIATRDSGISFGEGWYAIERYAPDESFRWVNDRAEVTLEPPSNPPPPLLFDLEPGPGVAGRPFLLQVTDDAGHVLGARLVSGRETLELVLPPAKGDRLSFRFHVPAGGLAVPSDPRIMNFRVFSCRWKTSRQSHEPERPLAESGPLAALFGRRASGSRVLAEANRLVIPGSAPANVGPAAPPSAAANAGPAEPPGPVFLHTNTCGDFTLMAREHWFDLRGYPEWDMYSFHIDSVLCYAAHHGGAAEEVLRDPMRCYHIEHGLGSGWTPEGESALFTRLRERGIPWIEYAELVTWISQMRRFDCPMIFNRDNWGLADCELPESTPGAH